jgi:hypothetical protein
VERTADGFWFFERIVRDGKQKLLISQDYKRVQVDGPRGF